MLMIVIVLTSKQFSVKAYYITIAILPIVRPIYFCAVAVKSIIVKIVNAFETIIIRKCDL